MARIYRHGYTRTAPDGRKTHKQLRRWYVEYTDADGCGASFWSDLSASQTQAFIAELHRDGRSVQTANFYLSVVKAFCRWMVRDGRAPDSPRRPPASGQRPHRPAP